MLAATNLPETLDPALTRPGCARARPGSATRSADPLFFYVRRFDRVVHVPPPDVGGRKAILAHYLKDKPCGADVDVGALARGTSGFSGAELANLVNVAAVQACIPPFYHPNVFCMFFLYVFITGNPSVQAALCGEEMVTAQRLDLARDRLLMGNERKSAVLSDESRRLTAYHEGGHALVALRTAGAMPLHKATIMPRGA